MFGQGKMNKEAIYQINDLKDRVEKLEQWKRCQTGQHEWALISSKEYRNPAFDNQSKVLCRHCFVDRR